MFSYCGLESLLKRAGAVAPLLALRDWNGQPALILRHDIDIDPLQALDLARLEAEWGVTGTYCVLVSSPTYNILSSHVRRAVREIASLGFEIALHFDPSVHGGADDETLAVALAREGDILAETAQVPVVSVSLHNPSADNRYPLFPGWRNAYDPEIFAPACYLSDSRMRFLRDPFEFIEQSSGRTLQLCLHPEHYSQDGDPYPMPWLRMLDGFTAYCDEVFGPNDAYAEAVCGRGLARSFAEHVRRGTEPAGQDASAGRNGR